MVADCALSAWLGLAAAVITALGGVLGALLHRQGTELARIRGLLNGTRQEALREIEGLYRERVARRDPLRRHLDQLAAEIEHTDPRVNPGGGTT